MHAQEQALAKLPPAERARLKADFKKKRGRPPGSKDSRPRRRRLKDGEEGSVEAPEGLMYVTGSDGAVEVRPIPAAPRGGLFALPQQQQHQHQQHQPQPHQPPQQPQHEARAREESSANFGMAQYDQYKKPMESPGGCQEDETPMYAGGAGSSSSSSSSRSHAVHHAADEPASMEHWYLAHDDEQNCEPGHAPEYDQEVEPHSANNGSSSPDDNFLSYEDEEDNSPQLLCGPVDDELAPAVNYYSHYCASTELTMQSFIDDAKKAAASGAGAGAPAAVWMPPMHAEERVAPRCQCQCSCGKGHASGEHQHHQHGHHHGMQQQEHQHHGHHQHQPKYQHGHHHNKHAPSAPSAASTSHGDWSWMPSPREEWGHHQAASSSSAAAHHPHGAAAPVLVAPIKPEMTAWRPAAGEPGGGHATDFSSFKRDGSHDEASWNLGFLDSGVWQAHSPPCPW